MSAPIAPDAWEQGGGFLVYIDHELEREARAAELALADVRSRPVSFGGQLDCVPFLGVTSEAIIWAPAPEPDVREFPQATEPATFADVVGQERALRLLRLEVQAARREGRRLADLLFVGPPGVGKTLLATATANEAGCAVYPTTGPELATAELAVAAVRGCVALHEATGKSVALVIDEADGMPRQASYGLHSLMVAGTVTWRGETYGGSFITILATSNRLGKVPPALRSRFAEVVHVEYHPPEDLARIAGREAEGRGIDLAEGVADFIGANAAGEARKVGHLIRALANVLPDGETEATLQHAREALALSGLYPGGLDRAQFKYLEFLAASENGTAGVNSLAAYVGTDTSDVIAGVEPFLIRSRIAEITRAGRRLTTKGLDYLQGAAA